MNGGNPLRVFVCGGRDFRDAETLRRVLDAVQRSTGLAVLLEGGDRAGLFAAEWAVERSIPVLTIRSLHRDADVRDRGVRVGRIVEEGKPDLAIGFAGGRRTEDLLEQIERAGVRVFRVPATAGAH